MNLLILLKAIAIVATVLFLIELIIQTVHVSKGVKVPKWRVITNWVLIVIIILGFGGAYFLSHGTHNRADQPASRQVVKKEAKEKPTINFQTPLKLTKDNVVNETFTIAGGSKLQLIRTDNQQVLASIDNSNGQRAIKFSYLFGQSGTFDIVATNQGGKQVVKKLVINPAEPAADKASSSANANSGHQGYQWRLVPNAKR